MSIAVSTSCGHFDRFCARFHAELRPNLCGPKSSSTVRSLGRPLRRCQSAGRRLMAALRAREWSCDGSAWAMSPNGRRRLDVIREVARSWVLRQLPRRLFDIKVIFDVCFDTETILRVSRLHDCHTICASYGHPQRHWRIHGIRLRSLSNCRICMHAVIMLVN